METAAAITAAYSDVKEAGRTELRLEGAGGEVTLTVTPRPKEAFRDRMI
jgi:hypothetical protein